MAVTREEVAQIYVATFNRAPLDAGLDYWTNSGFTIEQIAGSFFDQEEAQAIYTDNGEPIPSEDFVNIIFDNLFNREPAEAGLEYWSEALDAGTVSQAEMILAVANGATGDDAQILANKTTAGLHYADEGGEATDWDLSPIDATDESLQAMIDDIDDALAPAPVEGEVFSLTSGTDRGTDFEGTVNNDTFDAPIVQNAFAGGVSNSLSSADRLDGGAGTDTLNAELVDEFVSATTGYHIDVQPTTTSIEDINIEARDFAQIAGNVITLDAKKMTDIDEIGSYMSDADLVIENLTTLESNGNIRLTKDMTITMDHTDNFNSDNDASDLTVYFDEDYLNLTTDEVGSALTLRINNVLNIKEGNNPVENFDYINFTVGTTAIRVDVTGSTTYEEIKDKINAELTSLGLTTVEAVVDAAENVYFSQTTTTDTNTYPANSFAGTFNPITITNTGTEELVKGQIELAQGQTDGDINNTWSSTPAIEIENPITINVELDKAGRDGEGGDLIIGGKDLDIDGDTDDDHNDGIQIFDVTVQGDEARPSHLGIMASTNAELETVNIVSEARDDDSYAALTVSGNTAGTDQDNASDVSPFGGTLETLDADGFKGDLAIGTEFSALNINDFDAAGGGDVTLVHTTTSNGFVAAVDEPQEYNDVFTVDTGSGEDNITLDIDMDDSAIHTYSNTINTGSNDDTVDLTYSDQTPTNFRNTVQIDQIQINTDDGDDEVTIGAGDGVFSTADVDLGAGDDTIFISNDAAKAQWVFNADPAGTSYIGRGDVEHQVFKLQLAVEFEGVTTDFVQVSYDAVEYTTSATAINDAVKAAIDGDDVMSQLLETTDLRDNGLQIDALVDRALDADDLNIVFLAPKYNEFIDSATGDNDAVLEQDDSALYQNDSAEIFAARDTVTAVEMANAHNAWFLDSTGVDGDLITNDVSNSVVGDIIYGGDTAQNETALYNSMFRAADSDDVNSSSQSGEINADPANDDNDNGADLNAATQIDQNMNYDPAIGYNKINTATGANNNEVSITEITGCAGDDLLVLNSNNSARSGFETLVLTENFGTDTVLNFHTANAVATQDVIDYSEFLDVAARDRAESADANDNRVDQKVGFEFYNTVDNENANAAANNGINDNNEITGDALIVNGEGIIDHNTVISIEFSDLFDELQTTGVGGETVATYEEVTDTMISRALNAIIDDNDFQLADDDALTAGLVTESELAGGEVVFNVVYDRQIEQSTVNSTEYVLGDDTDYHTMAVYTATIAHNGETDADGDEADDLSLTDVAKQGVLDFGDLFSDLADLTDDSMLGTAHQVATAAAELDNIVSPDVADTTAPTLVSTNPADNATDIAVANDIVLTFSEDVVAGTGQVGLFDAAAGTAVPSEVTFVDNTVIINPAADLAEGADYFVRVQSTAVEDAAGNAFAGFGDPASLNFTTEGESIVTEPPVPVNDEFTVGVDAEPTLLDVLANDTDADTAHEDLVIADVQAIDPAQGTVVVQDNQILFDPADGFTGDVTFGYGVSDGTNTANGSVTVTVSDDSSNVVDMAAGESYTATDGVVDVFQYAVDSSSGRAVGKDGEVSITGFNVAEDSLQFVDAGDNLTGANFTTFDGVSLAENPFADNTSIAFDADEGVSNLITIAGVQDSALDTIDFTVV